MTEADGIGIGVPVGTHLRALPDNHPCYAMVGLIAAESARIEHMLDMCIGTLLGTGIITAACVTGQLFGPNPRFNAIVQLCRHRNLPETIIRQVNTLSGRCMGEFEKRNRAVHDPWWEVEETEQSFQFRNKPKKDRAFGFHPVSEQNLRENLAELRKIRAQVVTLAFDIFDAMPSTPPAEDLPA